MNRQRHAISSLILSAIFALTLCGVAAAQTSPANVSGGSFLVVSRASNPAPTVPSMPGLSSALADSWRWNAVALANARLWAWSFAPAPVASYSRPVAVRRRAIH